MCAVLKLVALCCLLARPASGPHLSAGLSADPEGYARSMFLYRGMKDMEMDIDSFKRVGGAELAPMSTTGLGHVRQC